MTGFLTLQRVFVPREAATADFEFCMSLDTQTLAEWAVKALRNQIEIYREVIAIKNEALIRTLKSNDKKTKRMVRNALALDKPAIRKLFE